MIAISFAPYEPRKPKKHRKLSKQQLGWLAEQIKKEKANEKSN
jgi:hypothetical protein